MIERDMVKPRFKEKNIEILHCKNIHRPEMYGAAVYITDSFKAVQESQNWDRRLKVLVLDKGYLTLRINDEESQFRSPSLAIFKASDLITSVNENDARYRILFFHTNIVSRYLPIEDLESGKELDEIASRDYYFIEPFYYDKRDRYIPIDYIQSRYLLSLLDQMNQILTEQSHDLWRCEFRSFMYNLLFKIERQFREKRQKTSGKVELVDQICTYLQRLYNEPITLDELCAKFNINRTTLNRTFREHTGKTVIEFLLDLRLKMARELLERTELNVNEICLRTGFSDPSYFSRKFKKEIGSSPTQYRSRRGDELSFSS